MSSELFSALVLRPGGRLRNRVAKAVAMTKEQIGATVERFATAADLAEGETVLVHAGAGGVGMAAIQLAKRAGAIVIATASSDEKLKRLKELGLDHPINYATESFVERVNQLTDAQGVEVVLDSIGGQNLIASIGVLAYRGTLVSVGWPPVRARRSRRGRSGRATTRCTASFSAARSCRSMPASIP
jgi:NADPH:quinone reductase-like Zn-dependent oxidoreductase